MSENLVAVIRAKLDYPDRTAFIRGFAALISAGGMFVRTRQLKPVGSTIRFDFSLKSGERLLLGEGVVKKVKEGGESRRKAGMVIRFTKLNRATKRLVDDIVAYKTDGILPDTPGSDDAESVAPVEAEQERHEPGGVPQQNARADRGDGSMTEDGEFVPNMGSVSGVSARAGIAEPPTSRHTGELTSAGHVLEALLHAGADPESFDAALSGASDSLDGPGPLSVPGMPAEGGSPGAPFALGLDEAEVDDVLGNLFGSGDWGDADILPTSGGDLSADPRSIDIVGAMDSGEVSPQALEELKRLQALEEEALAAPYEERGEPTVEVWDGATDSATVGATAANGQDLAEPVFPGEDEYEKTDELSAAAALATQRLAEQNLLGPDDTSEDLPAVSVGVSGRQDAGDEVGDVAGAPGVDSGDVVAPDEVTAPAPDATLARALLAGEEADADDAEVDVDARIDDGDDEDVLGAAGIGASDQGLAPEERTASDTGLDGVDVAFADDGDGAESDAPPDALDAQPADAADPMSDDTVRIRPVDLSHPMPSQLGQDSPSDEVDGALARMDPEPDPAAEVEAAASPPDAASVESAPNSDGAAADSDAVAAEFAAVDAEFAAVNAEFDAVAGDSAPAPADSLPAVATSGPVRDEECLPLFGDAAARNRLAAPESRSAISAAIAVTVAERKLDDFELDLSELEDGPVLGRIGLAQLDAAELAEARAEAVADADDEQVDDLSDAGAPDPPQEPASAPWDVDQPPSSPESGGEVTLARSGSPDSSVELFSEPSQPAISLRPPVPVIPQPVADPVGELGDLLAEIQGKRPAHQVTGELELHLDPEQPPPSPSQDGPDASLATLLSAAEDEIKRHDEDPSRSEDAILDDVLGDVPQLPPQPRGAISTGADGDVAPPTIPKKKGLLSRFFKNR